MPYIRFSIWLPVAALALLTAGCSSSQSLSTRLFKAWNAKCKEAADLLETVKDVPSAKAAVPRLTAVMQELNKLNGQLEESYDPEDVGIAHSPPTKQIAEGIGEMQRLIMESVRIGKDPELRAALGDAWDLLPAAAMMDEAGNPIASP